MKKPASSSFCTVFFIFGLLAAAAMAAVTSGLQRNTKLPHSPHTRHHRFPYRRARLLHGRKKGRVDQPPPNCVRGGIVV